MRAAQPAGLRLAILAGGVLAVAVVALLVLWSPWRTSGVSSSPSPRGACAAAPGATQQDKDPSDSPEAPWPHVRGERVVVQFAVGGLPARYADLVGQAAAIWARSPCIQPVVVDTCASGAHCSTVVARVRGGGHDTDAESDSDDQGGVRRSNTITLYTKLLDDESDNGALATIVHEMGHTFGLVHRNNPRDVMNADTDNSTDPIPDAIDFANLVVIYG